MQLKILNCQCIFPEKISNKKEVATNILRKVDLDNETINRRILKLSGGQQQRFFIARALSCDPEIIVADKPTGNLDLETQQEIINVFKKLAQEEGKCVIIVIHYPEVAKNIDEVYKVVKILFIGIGSRI